MTPAAENGAAPVPPDVAELVIAARIVAYEDQSPEALHALDKAAEAFAERVPWDNDPGDVEPAVDRAVEPPPGSDALVGLWSKKAAAAAYTAAVAAAATPSLLARMAAETSPAADEDIVNLGKKISIDRTFLLPRGAREIELEASPSPERVPCDNDPEGDTAAPQSSSANNSGTRVEWLDYDQAIITVRWRYFFGLIAGPERSYRGSCTVWHDLSTGDRPGVETELALCSLWKRARLDRDEEVARHA